MVARLISVALLAGCVTEPTLSETSSASTVLDEVDAGCSTAVVLGLASQIAAQANCDHPGHYIEFAEGNGITFTSAAVLPFLESGALDDLRSVAAPLQPNSALRTVAQQYLLYQWFLGGQCRISAAATVGTSNHEGGRAVDLENYETVIDELSARGWSHDIPGDDVHFDHLASPDNRGEDVAAFQELWNRNHPTDLIATDGIYGPDTEARLIQAPVSGFDDVASCAPVTTPPGVIPPLDVESVPAADPPVEGGGCDAAAGGSGSGPLALLLAALTDGFRRRKTAARRLRVEPPTAETRWRTSPPAPL
jgi:uncharacterized protein (TIGR03382 family)